jgi:hypothetical protein
MPTDTALIGAIFEKVQATSNEVQQTVTEAMGYLAYGKGPWKHSIAVETTDRALKRTTLLLRQIRALRSALL